jgi:hypothetical protein
VDVEEIVDRAAAAAVNAPKHLQEAAFNRAFELLSRGQSTTPPAPPARGRRSSGAKRNTSPVPTTKGAGRNLAEVFDRTKVANVMAATPVLDRSLAVLRAARDNHQVDGLTAPQIAEILTSNLRISTRRQRVNEALDGARGLVSRERSGRSIVYRIMGSGEDFLDNGGSSAVAHGADAVARRPTRRRKRADKARKEESAQAPEKSPGGRGVTRRAVGRPGPKAVVQQLIETGFFSEPRGIAAIQENLARTRGHQYKPTDLSPALVRLLREGRLQRDRDESGQYKYRAG